MYEALATQGIGPLDLEVAKALNFRPQAIRKLPMAQRAKKARQIMLGKRNVELAYEFIGSYLLKEHKELVTSFLDATGVKHEDGMIENLDDAKPAAGKIAGAVAELDGKFEPEDVTLYLALCAEQWPNVTELETLWRARAQASAPH
jgi:hypothetical protein